MTQETPLPGYVHFFAGAAGGALGTCLTSPLEVVKTRLQSSQSGTFAVAQTAPWYARSKTWFCLSESIRQEGVRVLWRGLGPNLVGVVPSRSIYFFTYSFAKRNLAPLTGTTQENPLIHVLSAASAGLATTTATNPLWLIKTRLQLLRSGYGEHVSTVSVIQEIYNTSGLRGFYRGLSASYVGECQHPPSPLISANGSGLSHVKRLYD
jgi:solute carrier family 25, member 33/36